MKPELGVMTQLETENILDDLKFAAEHGFDWFEIGLDWKQNYDLSDEVVNEIKSIAEKNNIKLIVHTAFYLPTSTMLPEIREGLMKYIRKSVVLANQVKSDRLTIHPGYREMPEPAKDLCYESLINNLKEIVNIGKEYNVNICLENYDRSPNLICVELDRFLRVLKSVPGLKVTYDIGHANTSSNNPTEYFRAIKDYIMDIHIHDNNGEKDQHKCLGEGNIDFKEFFAECKKSGYKGPFVFELFPRNNILKGKKAFKEIWDNA